MTKSVKSASSILKLSTIFNMNLREFFKLLLSQMQGIVGFSENHCLNRNYFSVSILLHCSTNNAFRFLLKWLISEFFPVLLRGWLCWSYLSSYHHCDWRYLYIKRQNLELFVLLISQAVNSCKCLFRISPYMTRVYNLL